MLKRIFNVILSASVVLGTMSTVSLFKAEGADIDEPRIYFFKGFENAADLDTLVTSALSKSETATADVTVPENSGYMEISTGTAGATSDGPHVYFTDAEFYVKEQTDIVFETKMRYKISRGYISTWDTVASQRAKTFALSNDGTVKADYHANEPVIATLTNTEEWHNWAVVYSASSPERKIYLDGKLIATRNGEAGYDGKSENYYYKNKYFTFRLLPYMPRANSYVHYDYIKIYSANTMPDVKAKTVLGSANKLILDFNNTVINLTPDMISVSGNKVTDIKLNSMNEQLYEITLEKPFEGKSILIDGVSDSTGRMISDKTVNVEIERELSASTPVIIQSGEVVKEYDYSDEPIKAGTEVKNLSSESKNVSLYLNAYGYEAGSEKKLLASTVKNADVKVGETLTVETDELILPTGVTEIKAFIWENLNSISSVGSADKATYTSSEDGFPDFGTYVELGNVSFAKKTGAASTGLTKLGYRTYVAMIGTPAYVFEFDTYTGKYINSYECGSGLQHAVKVGSDGKVYTMITGSPDLYVYDPETQVNELIQADCCQGSSVWSMNYGADGDKSMLYMPVMSSDYKNIGTSVVEYDIDNKTLKAYNGFDIGCKYAHCATGDDEYVYVGSADSQSIATVSRMNKLTGEIVTWENDTDARPGSVSFIKVIGDFVFTRFGDNIIVIDKKTMEKADQFTGGRGQGNCVSDPDPSNPDLVYFNSNDGTKIKSYNLKTKVIENAMSTTTNYGNIVRWDFGRWIPDKNGVPGITGLGGKPEEPCIFHVIPATGAFTYTYCKFSDGFPGVPTKPSYLYVSRDDKLYVGGYEAGLNGFDLKTNSMIFSVENGNQHGMTMVNGKLFGGAYSTEAMYMYDPKRAISSYNPRKIASPSGVNRYYHTTDTNAGFGLSVGIADYGNPQGSVILVTYLNGAGKMKNYVGVIPKENINGVDYRNGYIYAGSTINVPQHEEEWSEEAHVAKIDARTGETVLMTTVNFDGLPKTTQIGEIKFGPDGLLYGLANAGQTIFAMNPEDLSVVRYHSFYPEENPAPTYKGDYLEFGAEGNLYAIISGTLHIINPETFETEILWGTCDLFRLDNDGNILKRRGTNSSGIVLVSIPVNQRQRLEIMIKNAKKYYKEAEYSAQSWAVFKEALAEAESMDIAAAYLPDVEAVARKLTFAIKDLQTVYDYEAGFAYPFK